MGLSFVMSFVRLGRPLLIVATVLCLIAGFVKSTSALSLKDVLEERITPAMNSEEQNHPHHHHRQQQQQQHVGQHHGLTQQQFQRQRRSVETCRLPDDLKERLRNAGDWDNVQLLGKIDGGEAINITADEHFHPFQDRVESGPTEPCPSTLNRGRGRREPLENRQLCPHYYKTRLLRAGYFPRSLKWAVCKCDACIQNDVLQCEQVYSSVTVLRPVGCLSGLQQYVEDVIEEVPVSCACAVE